MRSAAGESENGGTSGQRAAPHQKTLLEPRLEEFEEFIFRHVRGPRGGGFDEPPAPLRDQHGRFTPEVRVGGVARATGTLVPGAGEGSVGMGKGVRGGLFLSDPGRCGRALPIKKERR